MSKVILIVDDSTSIRQMIKFALSDAGYTVLEAVDGQDATTKLTNPLHLIITDVNMPNMNGIDLIKIIRANPAYKGLPILVLTTDSHEAAVQAGKAAGATGWIVKPFTKQQIQAVVQRILG